MSSKFPWDLLYLSPCLIAFAAVRTTTTHAKGLHRHKGGFLKIALSEHGGRSFKITVAEVKEHDPSLIASVVEIDLMTFSEPTWSRFTAGLMLRHGRTFLLQANGAIIGTSQLLRSWSAPQEAVLFSMSIRPGWRGHGLGTFFLEEISAVLIRSQVTSLVLEVDPENAPAIELYEKKFGFERQGICKQEYGDGQDRLHLRKTIEAPQSPALKVDLDRLQAGQPAHNEPGPVLHCPTNTEEVHSAT
jgi:ribosomal protein S18 acetylase RimI-like enzyme